MPHYDYKCGSCGYGFERFSSIADRNEPEREPCPSCGSGPVAMAFNKAPGGAIDMVRTANTKKPITDILDRISAKHPGNKMRRDLA